MRNEIPQLAGSPGLLTSHDPAVVHRVIQPRGHASAALGLRAHTRVAARAGGECACLKPGEQKIQHDRGTVDEEHHGWAPDAPGTGEAADRAVQGHKKAFEANDTQDDATGAARQGPALTPEGTGQSSTRRGEDVSGQEGKEEGRRDTGTQGESQRPTRDVNRARRHRRRPTGTNHRYPRRAGCRIRCGSRVDHTNPQVSQFGTSLRSRIRNAPRGQAFTSAAAPVKALVACPGFPVVSGEYG
jgi:hypothetical protein